MERSKIPGVGGPNDAEHHSGSRALAWLVSAALCGCAIGSDPSADALVRQDGRTGRSHPEPPAAWQSGGSLPAAPGSAPASPWPGSGFEPSKACDYLATDIKLSSIAFYQTVKVTVMQDGQPPAQRATDVVAGHRATVRAFVEPLAGWRPRNVTARLTAIAAPAAPPAVVEDTVSVQSKSTDGAWTSTFNLKLDAALVTPDLRYKLELFESEPCPAQPQVGNTDQARWPVTGEAALGARVVGDFKVVLVPFRYDADGSGRVPSLPPERVDDYRQAMEAEFPISWLDLSVRAPVGTDLTLTAQGGNWSHALDDLKTLRASDGVADDVFYYGLVEPKATGQEYCAFGCVLGLAPLAGPLAVGSRVGLGIGYGGKASVETFLHEIGHSLGRKHTPCGGPAHADQNYPVAGGGLDTWGLDLRTDTLKPPDSVFDFMSYCDPAWPSAYSYRGLMERISFINAAPHWSPALQRHRYRTIIVDPEVPITWGGVSEHVGWLQGPMMEQATILDADGSVITHVGVVRQPIGDLPRAAFVLVPDAEPSWHAIQLAGHPPLRFDLPDR
ncbi:MAG: M66 family metalloprotease [Proteobacteria bacterium]|nr:M66 family metalloprotease [Pseudomonadota bacterium]